MVQTPLPSQWHPSASGGRRTQSRNAELFCRPMLHGGMGFPTQGLFFPKTKELGKQPHDLVRNENQPCLLGLGLLFTSTVGAWQLQLKANPLAWARLCTLPSDASRAGPALVFTWSFPVLQRRLLAAAGMQQAPREAVAAARQGRATPQPSSGWT